MLLSKAAALSSGRLLAPAAAAAACWCASGRLGRALGRGFAGASEQDESTLGSMKKVASKGGGDPAREWMQGTKEKASAYASNLESSAEEVYEATKRATQDVTAHAKEAMSRSGLKDVKSMASDASRGGGGGVEGMAARVSQAAGAAGQKVSEAASQAAHAVKDRVGGEEEVLSARAEFARTRSPEQQADENKDRKSQLTDEATTGDNPQEQMARDEKQINEGEFYTRF